MLRKNLFYKKNKNKKYLIFFSSIIIFLIFFLYFLKINNDEYFVIPSNNDSFFYIPEDKGGKEIPNQEKKGLHLSYDENKKYSNFKKNIKKYSIQVFTSTEYKQVKDMRTKLLNTEDSIFLPKDLSIAIFRSSLGNEYYLLYKNLETRIKAQEYCIKYVYFLDNCIVVNVQNLY